MHGPIFTSHPGPNQWWARLLLTMLLRVGKFELPEKAESHGKLFIPNPFNHGRKVSKRGPLNIVLQALTIEEFIHDICFHQY